jgi:hypothetical protein
MNLLEKEARKILIKHNFEPSKPPLNHTYFFPPWISIKFDKKKQIGNRQNHEDEIAYWRDLFITVESKPVRELFEICLSDAITRKYNIRMMGTGVGRFAFEIKNVNVSTTVKSNIIWVQKTVSLLSAIKKSYGLKIEPSKIVVGDAKKMELADNTISIVITSPPYLPASSGREDYLIGKSIAITALGLLTSDDIRIRETQSVGSMKVNGTLKSNELPSEIIELYNWLKNDELRCIKAEPIVFYYQDLIRALKEIFRVLLPGGLAIFIIGKESVFYNFKTREVLYRVYCDKIFMKIAAQQGFLIANQFDIELDKKSSNARPRSRDSFFETVFILKKP